jgi:hypothetical protein
MAYGALYDQPAEASIATAPNAPVDPHFEKMLYDNAQLLGLYARCGSTRKSLSIGASRSARATICATGCCRQKAASIPQRTPR